MILVISDSHDTTTNEVIDWLIKYDVDWFRINGNDTITIKNISIINGDLNYTLVINGSKEIEFKEIHSYWYRRNNLNLHYVNKFDSKEEEDNEFSQILNQLYGRLKQDQESYQRFLHTTLKRYKNGIGFYYDNNTNKLLNLLLVNFLGMKVPNTMICDNKKELRDFMNKEQYIITKHNDTAICLFTNESVITMPTKKIKKKDLDKIPEFFFPTLFQTQIKKKFEIRSFYLKGKFWSEAIFSQNNQKTQVDFRNYDWNNPNRTIRYNLPKRIQNILDKFMKKIHMDTGSFDIIYTTKNEYVFLEINPVGQFKQVSLPCNYSLEKQIANYLIHGANETF